MRVRENAPRLVGLSLECSEPSGYGLGRSGHDGPGEGVGSRHDYRLTNRRGAINGDA